MEAFIYKPLLYCYIILLGNIIPTSHAELVSAPHVHSDHATGNRLRSSVGIKSEVLLPRFVSAPWKLLPSGPLQAARLAERAGRPSPCVFAQQQYRMARAKIQ